jgi:hypothetical protein
MTAARTLAIHRGNEVMGRFRNAGWGRVARARTCREPFHDGQDRGRMEAVDAGALTDSDEARPSATILRIEPMQ